jgi:Tfp pilus assembly protein PilO
MDLAGTISKLSAREKAVVALTAIFVLVFIPYSFMHQPAQKAIASKRADLNNLTLEMKTLNSSIAAKVGREKVEDMPVITLPEANNLAEMLAAISLEAEQNGVEFISITQEGFSQRGQYLDLRLKLEMRSRYRPLTNFVRQIGDKHRLFMIQSLRYETNEALYPSGVAILRAVAYLEKK